MLVRGVFISCVTFAIKSFLERSARFVSVTSVIKKHVCVLRRIETQSIVAPVERAVKQSVFAA